MPFFGLLQRPQANSRSDNALRPAHSAPALAPRAHSISISVRTLGGSVKHPKNLLLDADALKRADVYCEYHHTTLSLLVSDFLRSLPLPLAKPQAKSPIVARLRGAATKSALANESYYDLVYGDRRKGFHEDW